MDAIPGSQGDSNRLSSLMEIALLASDSTKPAIGSRKDERFPRDDGLDPLEAGLRLKRSGGAGPLDAAASRAGSTGAPEANAAVKIPQTAPPAPDSQRSGSVRGG